MKVVGRIILIVVGIIMLVAAVPIIIESVKQLSTMGWQEFFQDPSKLSIFATIIGQGINAMFGLTALIAGIIGKKSFRLALCAIIMMIAPTVTVVTAVQAGRALDFNFWLLTVSSYLLPLLYFVGFLLA